jgi:catechol 2,3-dioxygenase-like lactoylglutathione lyase family enzyme
MSRQDPPFSVLHLDHLVIRVRDVERMVDFYRHRLGCPLERVAADIGLHQLRAGSSLIDLVDAEGPLGREGGPPPTGSGGNMDHLCLRVDPFDADAIEAWLSAADIPHSPPARRYGADGFGSSIYLEDPEGNRVELKGAPEAGPGPATTQAAS